MALIPTLQRTEVRLGLNDYKFGPGVRKKEKIEEQLRVWGGIWCCKQCFPGIWPHSCAPISLWNAPWDRGSWSRTSRFLPPWVPGKFQPLPLQILPDPSLAYSHSRHRKSNNRRINFFPKKGLTVFSHNPLDSIVSTLIWDRLSLCLEKNLTV